MTILPVPPTPSRITTPSSAVPSPTVPLFGASASAEDKLQNLFYGKKYKRIRRIGLAISAPIMAGLMWMGNAASNRPIAQMQHKLNSIYEQWQNQSAITIVLQDNVQQRERLDGFEHTNESGAALKSASQQLEYTDTHHLIQGLKQEIAAYREQNNLVKDIPLPDDATMEKVMVLSDAILSHVEDEGSTAFFDLIDGWLTQEGSKYYNTDELTALDEHLQKTQTELHAFQAGRKNNLRLSVISMIASSVFLATEIIALSGIIKKPNQ